jgi:hypothetical protein
MAHLARVGEVSDHTGKASTMLAATIGYPGSSIAFAQLLTGMERAGLIQREIRGKRTYRIIPGPAAPPPDALTPAAPAPGASPVGAQAPGGGSRPDRERTWPAAAPAQPAPGPAGAPGGTAPRTDAVMAEVPGTGAPGGTAPRTDAVMAEVPGTGAPAGTAQRADAAAAEAPGTGAPAENGPGETGPAAAGLNLPAGPGGLDYDELARRLLVQVVRRLAGPDAGPAPADRDAGDPGTADRTATDRSAATGSAQPGQPGPHETALQETVASLERKLASATTRQRRLAEENSRLREQLRAAEQSLADAQDRATAEALAGRFDSAEVLLLERLLSPLREARRRTTEADAG